MENKTDSIDVSLTKSESKRKANGKITNEVKHQKWKAKQARKEEQAQKEQCRQEWFEHNRTWCTQLSLQDVKQRLESDCSELWPYVNLKEQGSTQQGLFIAEGTETVRLLIQQASKPDAVRIHSILVKPTTLLEEPVCLLNDIQANRPKALRVYVAAEDALSAIAGFHISRGALACGYIPTRYTEEWLFSFIQDSPRRLLALDGICDAANMGAIIRCASAFGVGAVILSKDCCDAWYRQSVRVSMGHIFNVAIVRVDDLAATLKRLDTTTYAAVIDANADLVLETVGRGEIPAFWCCVVGNEGNGISEVVVEACTSRIRIGMVDGVDSLSLPIATGILLHGLVERSKLTK